MRQPDLPVIVAQFFVVTAVTAIRPAISYKALELGAPDAVVGVIGASYAALSLLFLIRFGRRIDRRGPGATFWFGCALILTGSILLVILPSLALLPVGVAVVGLGHVSVELSAEAVAAELGQGRERQRRFARMSVGTSAGHMIGPAMGGLLMGTSFTATSSPTHTVFVASAVLAVAGAAVAYRQRVWSMVAKTIPPGVPRSGPPITQMLRQRHVAGPMLVSVAVLTAIDVTIVYLPVFGEQRGLSPEFVGLLIGLRGAAGLISRLFVARTWVTLPVPRLLGLNLGLAGIGMLGVALFNEPAVLLACVFIAGFGLGAGQPLAATWIASTVAPESVATALSLRLVGNRVGQLVLPSLLGGVAGVGGVGAVFAAGAVTVGSAGGWVSRLRQ